MSPSTQHGFFVRILGRRLSTTEDGKPALLGFATTRFVEAPAEEKAAEIAVRSVRQECERLTREGCPPPEVEVHRVEKLSDQYRGPRPTSGFTFFEEEVQ